MFCLGNGLKKVMAIAMLVMATLCFSKFCAAQEVLETTGGNDTTLDTAPPTVPIVPPGVDTCHDMISCLIAITTNTYASLQAVNTLPAYIQSATEYIKSWMKSDKSEGTKQMQSDFSVIGTSFVNNSNMVNKADNMRQLMTDQLGPPIIKSDFINPQNSPKILKTVPNVNDLSYGTVINLAPVTKGADASPYNYIKNASGMSFTHTIPGNWRGRTSDVTTYKNYYNVISSVLSYNSYVLDYLVAESANGNQLTPMQNDLISQAANGTWLATVATEELGLVLRQTLMFLSQSYVLLTQLLQTQKQMLTAQVMTNSLLITLNQDKEHLILAKAQGVPP